MIELTALTKRYGGFTAVDAIDELRTELGRRGITFAMARVKQDLRDDLRRAGLLDRIGPDLIFPTLPTAVEAFRVAPSRTRVAPSSTRVAPPHASHDPQDRH